VASGLISKSHASGLLTIGLKRALFKIYSRSFLVECTSTQLLLIPPYLPSVYFEVSIAIFIS